MFAVLLISISLYGLVLVSAVPVLLEKFFFTFVVSKWVRSLFNYYRNLKSIAGNASNDQPVGCYGRGLV
jgi:hypothetical protein